MSMVASLPRAVARLRARCARIGGDDLEKVIATEAVGIHTEHDLRLVLAALGYPAGCTAEDIILNTDDTDDIMFDTDHADEAGT